MGEQGAKPEVLPGDLITRPGLYESRSQGVVEVRHWGRDGWVAQWEDKERLYFSDGTRTGLYPMPDPYQLLHWVGPLPASEPEPETTTEQLAEIDRDMADIERQVAELVAEAQQADYPPPQPQSQPVQVREGRWRTRNGDIRNVTPTPAYDSRAKRWPWRDAAYDQTWTPNGQNHFGCEESPSDLAEYLGPIEADKTQELPDKTQELPDKTQELPDEYTPPEGWRVLQVGEVLQLGDVWVNHEGESRPTKRVGERVNDERYIRPIEPQPEPEPQSESIQVREGRWRTRGGDIRNVTPTPEGDGREHSFPWWDAQYRQTWTSDGRYHTRSESPLDLVEYLGPIEPQIEPQPQPVPEPDAELRIRLLKEANDSQAETIGRLLTEARDLNMEIGGLERRLSERDARIRDLETMHAAAAQAVVDAGKQNDALRLQVQNQQQECERQKGRIEFLETLNKIFNAAINGYKTQVAELLGSVDTARDQLEAAASERDELRAAIDQADKQLDQKDAQIRDLRIELDAAQQVPRPLGDEERERIWNEATEAAGRQVNQWLRPLTRAFNRHPDALFYRMMALTIQVLPDVLPELLGYAGEDESLDSDEDCE